MCFTECGHAVSKAKELIDLAEGELVFNANEDISKEEAKEKLDEFHEDPAMYPQFNVEINNGEEWLSLWLECYTRVDGSGGHYYIITLA